MQKKIQGTITLIIFCIGMILLVQSSPVHAAQASAEFELTPILPKNQNTQVVNHFSLNVRPQRPQDLQVVITNLTDRKLKIYQSVGNAYTKTNGIISTDTPKVAEKFNSDSSLKYQFVNSFRLLDPKVITLAPHAHVTVTGRFIGNVDLRFVGLIMGGWNFTTKHKHEQVITSQSMWVDLHVTKRLQPNIVLQNVEVERQRHHENLVVHVENAVPAAFYGEVNATVLNDKKQLVSQVSYPQLRIAPNSNFLLDVLASGVHLQAGKYILKIDTDDALTKQQRHLTRQLTIAKAGQHQAVTSDKQPIPWGWIFSGISATVAIIAIGGWISNRRK
ncbi:WxL protein peptidoglycan domain-containing protein [Periweissella fabalis]|uniref:DUF916 domain-containing protein n=1 Tax=Periweissella fabalis TaxID=1070421 RepID=A0A7X6N261_9LACO|nr:DUF916 domain-containing protein [Periweissella fabalis]NKZ23715.1 DUF916 domain-containing protein [Periweissella fabalis]